MIESLKKWLELNNISFNERDDLVYINGWGKALVQDMKDRPHIFKKNRDGETIFYSSESLEVLKADEIWYIIFQFGLCWYYIDIREEKLTFHILKYVGKAVEQETKCLFYPLGIHTGYELLNGSGSLATWTEKAKFLGYKGIGICDSNTFAASLDLQKECEKRGMLYCFGYSLTIQIGNEKVGAKVYAKSQAGFRNILRIQKAVNIDRDDKLIDVSDVFKYSAGNVLVFDKWSGEWCSSNKAMVSDFSTTFNGKVYFQVDLSEYRANRIDERLLSSIKSYFDSFYIKNGEYECGLNPILIQDMYYPDEDDWKSKIILNKIDVGAAHEVSHKQYMKTLDELFDEFDEMFSDKYDEGVFYDMCKSTCDIVENACCKYDMSENYAPKYDLTESEKLEFGTAHNMFNKLLEKGFEELVPNDKEEVYRKRLEYEKYVIESTDNIDYFLITRDEINWAQEHGILTGIGRGSAGGCLILYLLKITNIDPIKWGLIFERFLLPERGGLSPAEVTKVCGEMVSSNEFYELELENGKKYRFDRDAQFLVNRDDDIIAVYADELKDDDDIIFDNKDLIFTLNELGDEDIKD